MDPIFLTLGFTSVIGQIVLMRELVAVFYGNELVFGLILAWWLLWEALGAWGLGRWAERHRWGNRALALALTFAGLALPLQIILTRSIRDLLGTTPGALVPLGQIILAIGILLAAYCLLHGLSFSLGARLLSPQSAGRAYAVESAGAVAGGALFSFILIHLLDPFQVMLLVTVGAWIVVLSLTRISRPLILLIILLGGVAIALPAGAWLDRTTLNRQWPHLLFAEDSRYGRLTITGLGGQRAFFENGLLAFETESTFPEQVVHLPLLAYSLPQRVLLIGGGVSGDLLEIFKHDVAAVTYVELDPLVIESARTHLPPEQAAVLSDPRLDLIYQDGRRYTKGSQEQFDVIILDLPEPSTGQLNRFFTLEFFQEVKAILVDGGVFSLGLPSAENYWNPELARRNASVYRTLRQVFPTVVVTPGDHNFILATADDPFPSPTVLAQRLDQRGINTRWVTSNYLEFLFKGDRFFTVQADLERASDAKLNRDLTPICYYYDLALWVSRFGRGFRGWFETTSLLRIGWLVLPLIVATAVLWGRRRTTALGLVGGAGFAGMTLQIVLLLAFQALHGYVYHQVGLLVTAFMAGLALGAGVISRQMSRARMRWLAVIQAGMAIFALMLAATLPLGLPVPALTFPVLAAAAGALTGAVFPLAVFLFPSDDYPSIRTGGVAGLLYGADLVGGCVGAIGASVVLVPVMGVIQTCVTVALVAGVGALLSLHPSFTNAC